MGSWTISICECGDQNSYFKPPGFVKRWRSVDPLEVLQQVIITDNDEPAVYSPKDNIITQ